MTIGTFIVCLFATMTLLLTTTICFLGMLGAETASKKGLCLMLTLISLFLMCLPIGRIIHDLNLL